MTGVFTDLFARGADGATTTTSGLAAPAERPLRCRCARTCTCGTGAPCRCRGACQCGTAAPPGSASASARTDLWAEAGEAEFGARRGRPAAPRSAAPARPAAGRGPQPPLLAQRSRQMDHARRRRRLQRLNQYFAWRFGWGRQLARIGERLGCGPCLPGSLAFLTAMARWQRRHGLRVTGVLTPALAPWLLGPAPDPGMPPEPADPAPAMPARADSPDDPYGPPEGADEPNDPAGMDGPPADADDEYALFGRPACGCR